MKSARGPLQLRCFDPRASVDEAESESSRRRSMTATRRRRSVADGKLGQATRSAQWVTGWLGNFPGINLGGWDFNGFFEQNKGDRMGDF